MIKNITNLSAIALTTLLMSSGAIAHSGKFLADGNGNKVLDGFGACVLAANGTDSCAPPAAALVTKKPVIKPAPAPKPIVVPEPPKRIVQNISLSGDALFASNSAVLTDAGKVAVDPIVVAARKLNDPEISLVGHADSRGDAGYNQKLSERRAASVAEYLVSKGINASSITSSGRGESSPIASNDTREGRSKNRRVDASLSGEKITFK